MDSAVDVFSAQVSKVSRQLETVTGAFVCLIWLRTSLLTVGLCSFLFFVVCVWSFFVLCCGAFSFRQYLLFLGASSSCYYFFFEVYV